MTRPDGPNLKGWGLLSVVGLCGYVLLALRLGIPFAIPVGIISALSVAVVLRGPLGHAISRRLEGTPPAASDEVFAELDDLRNRVVELEERQDFTERLLTQVRESNRLGEPANDTETRT
jgi:hypothetical protein